MTQPLRPAGATRAVSNSMRLRRGQVLGWIDIGNLLSEEEMHTAQVPNGIAFDPAGDRLLVTGKFWPWIFEIEVLPYGEP